MTEGACEASAFTGGGGADATRRAGFVCRVGRGPPFSATREQAPRTYASGRGEGGSHSQQRRQAHIWTSNASAI